MEPWLHGQIDVSHFACVTANLLNNRANFLCS